MTINRVGATQGVTPQPRKSTTPKVTSSTGDTLAISKEGLKNAEFFKTREIVLNSPDIREDRVSEVRAKLEDPNYLNQEVKEAIADRLLENWL